jgi:hypothetical protein
MLARGDTLAGYRIDDIIGVGGMAIVYRAEQVSLGRPVALKVLSPELSNDEAFCERFRREGKHAAALHHPNLVTIFDSGEADGRLFLAMQLVDGSTLAATMAGRSLSADETMFLLTPIGSALDAAHAMGLVHRDVKPQNILLDLSGHPYLADFGIAKGVAGTAGLTATGGFVGSLNYAAPEQIRGETVTAAADTYALTAVLYQCLTGQVPYPRDTDASVMYAHLHDAPPSLSSGTSVAAAMSRVIARGMAKEPADRFSQVGGMIREATAVVAGMSPAERQGAPPFPFAHASTTRGAEATEPYSQDSTTANVVRTPVALPHARSSRDVTAVQPAAANPAPMPGGAPPLTGDRTTADRRREAVTAPAFPPASPRRRRALALGAAAVVVAAAGATAALLISGPKSHASHVADRTKPGATGPTGATARQGATAATNATASTGSTGTASATGGTAAAGSTGSTADTGSPASRSTDASPAALELASPPNGGYSIMVPSNWSYHAGTSAPGRTTDLWVGANPLEKIEIVVSTCASCATDAGGPNPRAVGLPAGTVSSFASNSWAMGFQASTSGNPYPDNGVIVVTAQGSTPTGYAQVSLWLPDGLHSTATRILDSFSPYQAASALSRASQRSAFHTPSDNVACYVEATGAMCSIASLDITFVLPTDGGVAFTEAGQAVPHDAGQVAAYGTSVSNGAVTCTVPPQSVPHGVTCADTGTSHGFEASRIAARQNVY